MVFSTFPCGPPTLTDSWRRFLPIHKPTFHRRRRTVPATLGHRKGSPVGVKEAREKGEPDHRIGATSVVKNVSRRRVDRQADVAPGTDKSVFLLSPDRVTISCPPLTRLDQKEQQGLTIRKKVGVNQRIVRPFPGRAWPAVEAHHPEPKPRTSPLGRAKTIAPSNPQVAAKPCRPCGISQIVELGPPWADTLLSVAWLL